MGFNKKLGQLFLESSCSLLIGDRGSGKSTLAALAIDEFKLREKRIFSNYPYKGAYRIPMVERTHGKVKQLYTDKEWLYSHDTSDSLVFLDEVKTIWNARDYKNWNERDEEFFNFIRKNKTTVIMASQVYDGVDLNCRRACDYTFFIQQSKFFRNWSTVDVSRTVQVKVADKQTQIVSRGYSKNAMKVNWELAELPISYCYFYRKPYYGDFETLYTTTSKPLPDMVLWDDLLENSQT